MCLSEKIKLNIDVFAYSQCKGPNKCDTERDVLGLFFGPLVYTLQSDTVFIRGFIHSLFSCFIILNPLNAKFINPLSTSIKLQLPTL